MPAAAAEIEPRERLVRRIFSLSGVAPLGVFLLLHVALNARALAGAAAFTSAAHAMQQLPGLAVLEAAFVYAPLALHGVLGLWLIATRRSLRPAPPYSPALRGWMRATGVVVVAFLAMHLPELRFHGPRELMDGGALSTRLDADLSSTWHGLPWRGIVYLASTAAVSLHFAVGAWAAFAATDRARASIRERRWAAWTMAAVGAAMWLTFADVVVYRATGTEIFGQTPREPPGAPCP